MDSLSQEDDNILMIKTITQLNRGKNIIKQNNVNKGSYNTWPTINQIKSFFRFWNYNILPLNF